MHVVDQTWLRLVTSRHPANVGDDSGAGEAQGAPEALAALRAVLLGLWWSPGRRRPVAIRNILPLCLVLARCAVYIAVGRCWFFGSQTGGYTLAPTLGGRRVLVRSGRIDGGPVGIRTEADRKHGGTASAVVVFRWRWATRDGKAM